MTAYNARDIDRIDSPQASAAAWFAYLRSDNRTDAETHAFELWLARSDANRAAWEDVSDTWTQLEALRSDPALLALRAEAQNFSPRPPIVMQPWFKIAASLLLAVGLGSLAFTLYKPMTGLSGAEQAIAYRELRTDVGQRATVRLADGSDVMLNTNTVLRIQDGNRQRHLTLISGQAFFKVAKDHSHPFTVTAGDNVVTAVGTAFDVRKDRDQTEVTLAEGKVKVDATSSANGQPSRTRSAMMVAGTHMVVRNDGRALVSTPVDTASATSWREGRLVFDNRPLRDVAAELNRYSRTILVLDSPALGNVPVTGVFSTGNNMTFAQSLQSYRLARIAAQDDKRILLRPY